LTATRRPEKFSPRSRSALPKNALRCFIGTPASLEDRVRLISFWIVQDCGDFSVGEMPAA
jgi:hypothetical protein